MNSAQKESASPAKTGGAQQNANQHEHYNSDAGFALVNLRRHSKRPVVPDWQRAAQGITDAAKVNGGNIGLHHLDSRTCCIDVDDVQECAAWFEGQGIDLTGLFMAEGAVQIRSGRDKRGKLLYRLPDGVDWLPYIKAANGKLELRCANSAKASQQDVLPPSIHPDTGKPYEWIGNWRSLPTLPDAILRVWLATAENDEPGSNYSNTAPDKRRIADGTRDNTLASMAGSMRRCGFDEDAIHAALTAHNGAYCEPPLPEPEVKKIARSIARYEPHSATSTQPETATTARLHLVECGDLSQATRSPIECVMNPYLPKRQVTLLGGHGGAGKTYLALVFAAHLAAGAPWSGHECQTGRVLFVSLEDEPDLIRWRLACVCGAYALDMTAVSAGIAIMDGTATAATLAIETGNGKKLEETRAWQDMAAYASGFDTVMVDNASDAFTANVNDPALVRVFLRKLKTVARHADAACLLLAHIDKAGARNGANGNSYIGTAAWHNTVRSRIALVDDDGALSLVHEKHNLTTEADTLHIQKAEHGVPMPMNAQDIQHDARMFEVMQAKKDAPEVLALLTKAVNGGEDISPTRKGVHTAWHVLPNFGLVGYGGRRGKARFWRAFDVLEENGSIGAEEYVNADYKRKQRIVLLAEKAA